MSKHKKNFLAFSKTYGIILTGDEMDRSHIDKIAQTQDDRMLLAKIWDKINTGMRRCVAASTPFLSPREQEMARYLFGEQEGLCSFGGYEDAERRMLIFLPEYLDEDWLCGNDSPIACLRCTFYEGDAPNHRDFLGALMGLGISRDCIGDICVDASSCDFFLTNDIVPYILQNFTSAGRAKLQVSIVPITEARIPQPEVKEVKDTLASLRLDSVISAGFRISRSHAAQYITAGKAAIDGLPCEKPDKAVSEGTKISLRGMGKIKLAAVNGQTKKGRISILIHKYL